MNLNEAFFAQDAISVAKALLGKKLTIRDKSLCITETEAYLGEKDLASHARFGKTKRSSIMYKKGGILYIFLIYGIHLCTNIVVGKTNDPQAVLIRAGIDEANVFISGPGRVSKYLGIQKKYNGESLLHSSEYSLSQGKIVHKDSIVQTPRIGVAYAKEWAQEKLRFVIDPEEML